MGISHDYHSTGRRRRGGPGGVIRFAGAVAGILLVSFAITAILEHGQAQPEELPTVTANGTAQNILAPLPMQGAADSTTCLLYTSPSPRDGLLSRMPSSA